jgi:VCBS repeat protein
MKHPSPHRAPVRPAPGSVPRLAGRVLLGLASILLAGRVHQDTVAAPPLKTLPAYAPGFPLLFPRPVDIRPREGSVVAADLDRDGRSELIASIPSGVLVVIEEGGTMRPGWPRRFPGWPQPIYPVGAPGVGDLDGDGVDEVVTCVISGASPNRTVLLFAIRADGSDLPGWPVVLPASGAQSAYSPAATLVVDLDGDGRAEVVRALGLAEVWAFDGGGLPLPGWPFRPGPDASGRRLAINASPSAADLDGDGRPEVLVVESGYAPRLMAIDFLGRLLPHFPIQLGEIVERQSPSAGDLDGDGRAEVVQATLPVMDNLLQPLRAPGVESTEIGPSVPAALHSLRGDGTEMSGWPFPLGADASWGAFLADLDGDGRPEVLQGDGNALYALDAGGTLLKGFPVMVHRGFSRSQAEQASQWAVADLDLDGRLEFVQARSNILDGWTQLRLLALRLGGQPVHGFPFTIDGLQAASQPIAVDLTGDRRPEVAILVTEGTNGGWRLLAWDVSRAGRAAGIAPSTGDWRTPPLTVVGTVPP